MVSRLSALLVMGFVGLFTLGFPINVLLSTGDTPSSPIPGMLAACILTAFVAFSGRPGSVWSRLCFVNGLAALALPLVALVFSAAIAPGLVNRASFAAGGTYAADAGAKAGAVLGGAMLTGAAALIGFFVAAIFLILAYVLRQKDGARA